MFYYTCLVPGGKVYTMRNTVTARHDCLDFRNYFIGERDSRPACTCLFSAGIEIDCMRDCTKISWFLRMELDSR